VIGAGSAGCVVVNRLSEDPHARVLLIEAGESGEHDPAVTTPGLWTSLIASQYDWNYNTEPEAGLANRRMIAPRGKAHGGSSAINAMVHIRGHRLSFDAWRALGNTGWGYDDLLPYFKRSEHNDGGLSDFRGVNGPLAVSRCRDPHAAHHAFLGAAAERGFGADADFDFNGPEPVGVAGFYQRNIRDGRRHSAAAAFLVPVLSRTNVEVRSGAHAIALATEGRRVSGVNYVREGRVERARATREVIVCAGAVDSPRLLMLSGIGPANDLHSLGIDIVADVPGVGQNLQDHLKLSVRWKGKSTLPGSTVTAGLYVSSDAASLPDLQFYVGRGASQPDDLVSITVSLVTPKSRGSIALRSAGPQAAPIIRANYLQADGDAAALVRGVRLARELGCSAAFDALRSIEVEPGAAITADGDLERFVRQKSETIYHLAGTCRMGLESDPLAVVDPSLRVHGIEGLRVADASIMPEIVNAPTHATCIAIGEKCAALISGR
jgi:choline dehydrogenase